MDATGIRGIIFDYGGTLDTHGRHWVHVLRQGWQAAGMHVPDDVFRQAYVQGERSLAVPGAVSVSDDFHAVLLKKTTAALEAIGNPARYSDKPHDFDMRVTASKIAERCDAIALANAQESARVLERLRQHYDLCLVSNFYGNLAAVLDGYRLRCYFPHIIESAMVGVRKPDPRIFSLGVTALGLEPHQTLVIGDSLDKDILPARAIGCHTAWLKGEGWDDTDAGIDMPCRIDTLTELYRILHLA